MQPIIIGINGKAQSGKDSVATLIQESMSLAEVRRLAFAQKLKESFAALLGIPVEWLELLKTSDSVIKIHPSYDLPMEMVESLWEIEMTFRVALQRYGTEAHRDIFGDNFWVEQAFNNIPVSDIVTITDVRFPNELEAVKDHDGFLVKVLRNKPGCDDSHPSEQDLPDDEFDWILDNTGTYDDLRHNVDLMMNEFVMDWGLDS